MIETFTEIPTADGRMDAFVTHPEEGGPFPAVIVLMDIWGLREELFDVARRVATVGYHCTVPNFWYRRGKVRFEWHTLRVSERAVERVAHQRLGVVASDHWMGHRFSISLSSIRARCNCALHPPAVTPSMPAISSWV